MYCFNNIKGQILVKVSTTASLLLQIYTLDTTYDRCNIYLTGRINRLNNIRRELGVLHHIPLWILDRPCQHVARPNLEMNQINQIGGLFFQLLF